MAKFKKQQSHTLSALKSGLVSIEEFSGQKILIDRLDEVYSLRIESLPGLAHKG